MVCFYPRRAPRVGGPAHIGYFPCGQCLACTINRRRVWTARQILESQGHSRNWFITLTYNDEHLPPEVQKAEVQKFMKRLRKNTGQELRYFACAEYGDKYGRPHFHLNLFGYQPDLFLKTIRTNRGTYEDIFQCRHLLKAWQDRGYHTLDEFTDKRAAYVANYVTKKENKCPGKRKGISPQVAEKLPKEDQEREPEFALMSRRPGIGAEKFLEFCTSRELAAWIAANPETAEVPRVFQQKGKYWPVGSYLRDYVHERTGYPLVAEIPVHVIAGQEKLRENYEETDKAEARERALQRAAKTRAEMKKARSHV